MTGPKLIGGALISLQDAYTKGFDDVEATLRWVSCDRALLVWL